MIYAEKYNVPLVLTFCKMTFQLHYLFLVAEENVKTFTKSPGGFLKSPSVQVYLS